MNELQPVNPPDMADVIPDSYLWVMTACQSQTIRILSQPCPRYLPSGWRLSHTEAHRNSIAHPQRKQEPGDCSILK